MHSTFSRLIRPFSLSIAAALALSACGGGGGSDTPSTTVVGVQTGVFVDSAVEGLSYETSSGVKGTTDAQGRFKYKEGDTVTFKIGGVTLGSGKAAGTVTPAHIAGGEDNNKFTNLLVLLQSLDTDGDPANGITLPASLDGTKIAAVAARLNDDPADFTDDTKNTELKDVSPQGAIRSREDARKHYEDTQAKTSAFADSAAGVWEGLREDEPCRMLLRLTPSGRYAMTVSCLNAEDPEVGVEVGSFTRDAATGLITASDIKVDSNGDGGWSKLGAGRSVSLALEAGNANAYHSDILTVTFKVGATETVYTLQRVEQRANTIVGAWSTSPDLRPSAPMAVFATGDQQYFIYAETQTTADAECSGKPGMEFGLYEHSSVNAVSNVGPSFVPSKALTITEVNADDTGCQGMSRYVGQAWPTQMAKDGNELSVLDPETGEVRFKLYRIKRDQEAFWDDFQG